MSSKTEKTQTINGITVKYPSSDDDAPLYCHFDGEFSVQPASIDFYPSRKLLTAGYSEDTGGAMSGDVFHGTCFEFPVNCLVERNHLHWMLDTLAERFLPDFLYEYSEKWDGRNDRGFLTDKGQSLRDDIEDWIYAVSQRVLVEDPDEWVDYYDEDEEDD